MDEAIKNHACFVELFKQIPGANRDIHIPVQVNFKTGQLYEKYWTVRVHRKPKGEQTIAMIMNFCPLCGEQLNSEYGQESDSGESLK